MTPFERVCPFCGKKFIVRHSFQKICGDEACKKARGREYVARRRNEDPEYKNHCNTYAREYAARRRRDDQEYRNHKNAQEREYRARKRKEDPEYKEHVKKYGREHMAQRRAERRSLSVKEETAVCSVCGESFTYLRTILPRTVCYKCRGKKSKAVPYERTCPECGKKFVTNNKRQIICGDKNCKKARWRKQNAQAKRRMYERSRNGGTNEQDIQNSAT
jgi:hypothetical protein